MSSRTERTGHMSSNDFGATDFFAKLSWDIFRTCPGHVLPLGQNPTNPPSFWQAPSVWHPPWLVIPHHQRPPQSDFGTNLVLHPGPFPNLLKIFLSILVLDLTMIHLSTNSAMTSVTHLLPQQPRTTLGTANLIHWANINVYLILSAPYGLTVYNWPHQQNPFENNLTKHLWQSLCYLSPLLFVPSADPLDYFPTAQAPTPNRTSTLGAKPPLQPLYLGGIPACLKSSLADPNLFKPDLSYNNPDDYSSLPLLVQPNPRSSTPIHPHVPPFQLVPWPGTTHLHQQDDHLHLWHNRILGKDNHICHCTLYWVTQQFEQKSPDPTILIDSSTNIPL